MARLLGDELRMRLPALFRRSEQKGWLAAALGDGSVRVVHIRRHERPAVHLMEERRWDRADAKGLEKVARKMRLAGYRCTTMLPASQYQILLTEAPPGVRREELKSAVRWRIKDMIDFPVNDATIDVLEIPQPASSTRPPNMYVVVARNDAVRGVMDRFAEARIPLRAIDIPDLAQRNIAALYESEQRALLVLSFDPAGGLLTITAGGELYSSRRLETTCEQVNAQAAAENGAFERVLIEVQRSLDHFERTFSQAAVEKVLVAPMARAAGLVRHLAGQLYLPVAAMDIAEVMDLPPAYAALPGEERAEWFRLIGAALRARPVAQ
ncbi:MAG: agglutinin biogenesis protein MshI [Betaproteobacteria bacterium]